MPAFATTGEKSLREAEKIKRKSKKGKKLGLWLKVLDLGLFMGFSSPILRHLGTISLPWALGAASLGLIAALAASWLLLKTASADSERLKRKEPQGGNQPWWS